MGLKKPIKTGSDLPTLNELVGVDVAPVETDGYIVLDTVPGQACALESNTPISIKAELGKFGDATAADVASGKTFTSAAGLKVTGSLVPGFTLVKTLVANGTTNTYQLDMSKNYLIISYCSSGEKFAGDMFDVSNGVVNTIFTYHTERFINNNTYVSSEGLLTSGAGSKSTNVDVRIYQEV